MAWRARADDLRRYAAAEEAAQAYEVCAQELTASLSEQFSRLLSVKEAALLTGRHRDTIGNAIATGALTNHGVKHRPRVRYADAVSLFPPREIARAAGQAYDSIPDARAFLGSRRGDL